MEATAVWQFPVPTDFIDLEEDFIAAAARCERLGVAAQDTENMAAQREIYRQLGEHLSHLLPILNEPIPPACQESFTVETRPAVSPTLNCDSDLLCEYCIALSELLAQGRMPISIEDTLQGLLSDLLRLQTDIISAPRWLRTPDGLEALV